jgi:hypothetical protein
MEKEIRTPSKVASLNLEPLSVLQVPLHNVQNRLWQSHTQQRVPYFRVAVDWLQFENQTSNLRRVLQCPYVPFSSHTRLITSRWRTHTASSAYSPYWYAATRIATCSVCIKSPSSAYTSSNFDHGLTEYRGVSNARWNASFASSL